MFCAKTASALASEKRNRNTATVAKDWERGPAQLVAAWKMGRLIIADLSSCVYKVITNGKLSQWISRNLTKETVLVRTPSRLLLSPGRWRVTKEETARLLVAIE